MHLRARVPPRLRPSRSRKPRVPAWVEMEKHPHQSLHRPQRRGMLEVLSAVQSIACVTALTRVLWWSARMGQEGAGGGFTLNVAIWS